jgi:hypothetical protein
MLAALIVVAVLLVVWTLVAVGYVASRTRLPTRRQAFVNLLDGTTVEGVLWRNRGAYLLLRESRLHGPEGAPVPVDGEVVIDRARVQFVQLVGGA